MEILFFVKIVKKLLLNALINLFVALLENLDEFPLVFVGLVDANK
jgi:hypothetical protein